MAFIILILILLNFIPSVAFAAMVEEGEKVNLNADKVIYQRQNDLVVATGNVHLQTEEIEMWADRMELEVENNKLYATGNVRTNTEDGELVSESIEYDLQLNSGLFIESEGIIISEQAEEPLHISSPEIDYSTDKSTFKSSQMTSCDYDYSHYYFQSKKVVIYPGDKLIAYHTVFWEFSGRLPLFYWPIFVYSLRHDDQLFQPEFGYHEQRGWFVRTTYNYYLSDNYDRSLFSFFERNVGQLYIDYYSNMGFAGGFKHYYNVKEDDQGFLYFYIEDDKRNRDLRPWIELELDRKIRSDNGERIFNFEYSNYHSNSYLTNPKRVDLFDITYSQQREFTSGENTFDISYEYEKEESSSEGEYDLELDYNFQQSFSGWDSELDTSYQRNSNYNNYFDLDLNLDKMSPNRYDDQLEVDLGYSYSDRDSSINNEYDIELDYTNHLTPEIDLEYDLAYLAKQTDDEPREWDYDTGVKLSENRGNYDWELETRFKGDQEGVSFYELPLAAVIFSPAIWIDNSYLNNLEVELGGANSYSRENADNLQQGHVELDYSDSFNLTDRNRINRFNHNFRQDAYDTGQQHWFYENEIRLTTRLLDNWENEIDYEYAIGNGDAPKGYKIGDSVHKVKNSLSWRDGSSNFYINTGYDLLDETYDSLRSRLNYQFNNHHSLNSILSYNLNTRHFNSFVNTYEIDYENFNYETGVKIDLNENQLEEWDNKLSWTTGDWKIQAANRYDYQQERFREANILIERNLHCRKIALAYDYLEGEILFRYEILAFPQSRTEVGTREGEGFLFDADLGGLLDDFE